MNEFEDAQKSLKIVLQLQQKQLREASQNIVSQYIKRRRRAKENCSIPSTVISDLTHQINVLENIKLSGLGLESHIKLQIEQYLQKYKRIKEELMANNKEVEEKQVEQQQKFEQKKPYKEQQTEVQLDQSIFTYSENLDNEQKLLNNTQQLKSLHDINGKTKGFFRAGPKIKKNLYILVQYGNCAIFTALLLQNFYSIFFH